VAPPDTVALKGGSIDWQGFHCLSLAGQMMVKNAPITFCMTVNWTGPARTTSACCGRVLPARGKAGSAGSIRGYGLELLKHETRVS
jgi:hypothetical protein